MMTVTTATPTFGRPRLDVGQAFKGGWNAFTADVVPLLVGTLIAIASRRYNVSAAGLAHMMKLESNGQRHADSGPYHGLFQFMDREWAMSWNEWRDHSIYDGWSQIQLAAKCISRGMGPSIWPLTYRMSF